VAYVTGSNRDLEAADADPAAAVRYQLCDWSGIFWNPRRQALQWSRLIIKIA
jgi:hypothetical protein